jgi:hypothetical protein
MFVRKSTYDRMKQRAEASEDAHIQLTIRLYSEVMKSHRLIETLKAIADNKTKRPNATVARVLKLVEEALAEVGEGTSDGTGDTTNEA